MDNREVSISVNKEKAAQINDNALYFIFMLDFKCMFVTILVM